MKKKWLTKETESIPPVMPEYPGIVLRLLALRGITDEAAVRDFLEPDYAKLLDPFIFKDMRKAVERIRLAIQNKQKVAVYADYDADAITALSVLYLAFKKLGLIVDYYIPDRFTEGYGMNVEAIRKLKENNTDLIITVDCGINAVEEARVAKEVGIDLIITDHHELTGELPQALAVINPKNPQDNYPFPFLTGVGVAFKVVQGMFLGDKIQGADGIEIPQGWEKWLLDLVAIGTVADLQSLTLENRILVSFGLKVLEKTKWPGLRALLEAAQFKGQFDTFALGFVIAPRINAAGRIKHADVAFRLLISDQILEAQNLAIELNEINKHRQMLTEQILSEAKAQAELLGDKKIILVAGEDWPKGVVGLVAGKLAEEYNRPVLVLNKSEAMATGSARSTENFDLVMALNDAKSLLVKYGGHKQAAGFTLESALVDEFYQRLLQYAESVSLENSEPTIKIDAELFEADLNFETIDYVEKLAPFGFGNPKPKFMSRDLELVDASAVGAAKQHAKMRVRLGNNVFSAIAFNKAFLLEKLQPGTKFDAVYELSTSEWNGLKRIDIKIIDIQTNETDNVL